MILWYTVGLKDSINKLSVLVDNEIAQDTIKTHKKRIEIMNIYVKEMTRS
jgi:hypothetical protein